MSRAIELIEAIRRRRPLTRCEHEEFALRSNLFTTITNVRTGRSERIAQGHNLVVTSGRNLVRDVMSGAATLFSHVALGTSSTAVAIGQTTLVAEAYRDLVTQFVPGTGTLAVILYVGTLQGNGNTYREMGLFGNAGATMYARSLISSPIAKTSSITITAEWDLTFG